MIHVAGELWSAVIEPGASDVSVGERVEVIGLEGLRLRVRPVVRKSSWLDYGQLVN
jgi:membrane protein implicated in regulation of membrane protease activity